MSANRAGAKPLLSAQGKGYNPLMVSLSNHPTLSGDPSFPPIDRKLPLVATAAEVVGDGAGFPGGGAG